MRWCTLGPLALCPADLWEITLGDISDMVDGYRYRDYLEQRKQAVLTANLINGMGNVKHPVHVDDLVGYWVNGRVMGKMDYWEYCKNKARRKKEAGNGSKRIK